MVMAPCVRPFRMRQAIGLAAEATVCQGVPRTIGIERHARGDDGIEGFDRVGHGDGKPCAGSGGGDTLNIVPLAARIALG